MNVFEENKELFDLGSSAVNEEFDPFAIEEETNESNAEEITAEQSQEGNPVPNQEETNPAAPEQAKTTKAEQSFEEKLPVFTYGGAAELKKCTMYRPLTRRFSARLLCLS